MKCGRRPAGLAGRQTAGRKEGRKVSDSDVVPPAVFERALTLVDLTEWPTVKEAAAAISTDFRHLFDVVSAQSLANAK